MLIILKSRPHDTRTPITAIVATTALNHLSETHYTTTTLITATNLSASVSSPFVQVQLPSQDNITINIPGNGKGSEYRYFPKQISYILPDVA